MGSVINMTQLLADVGAVLAAVAPILSIAIGLGLAVRLGSWVKSLLTSKKGG